MVKNPQEDREATVPLSLAHPLIEVMIPLPKRENIDALWAVDSALVQILQTGKEPSLQLIRLTWWRDQMLAMVHEKRPPANPVLENLGAIGSERLMADLASLAEQWGDFVEAESLDSESVDRLAAARGGALFKGTASLLGDAGSNPEDIAAAGRYWALVDLASHLSDAALRADLWKIVGAIQISTRGLPKPLGALTKLARHRARQRGLPKPLAEQALLLRFSIFGR